MEVTAVRKNRNLTHESLAGLLALLHEDGERAAEEYELLRAKLIRIFEWRSSTVPEDNADQTLDRIARKVAEGEVVRDVHAFAGGVARLIWLEAVKRERRTREVLEQMPHRDESTSDPDPRRECFGSCLGKLPDDARALVVEYYREEKSAKIERRKKLAASLGIAHGSLRLRVFRLRAQLEKCVSECLKKSAAG
jgi:DNA-directed RNA polymerase specialized sigma24 family protein